VVVIEPKLDRGSPRGKGGGGGKRGDGGAPAAGKVALMGVRAAGAVVKDRRLVDWCWPVRGGTGGTDGKLDWEVGELGSPVLPVALLPGDLPFLGRSLKWLSIFFSRPGGDGVSGLQRDWLGMELLCAMLMAAVLLPRSRPGPLSTGVDGGGGLSSEAAPVPVRARDTADE
jgi:hypothetical protein